MSVYFIANIRVSDEEECQKYLENNENIFNKCNGEYLVVDKKPGVLTEEWDYPRLVLMKFPDKDSLYKWYDSDEYPPVLKDRVIAAGLDAAMVN
ncbi:MAG: DUF1330 domain-containing protein [Defluviitaleaceae bacterium]|nr:DUF1330 domain-containing protein [Defluviitaleaceae bacterium]